MDDETAEMLKRRIKEGIRSMVMRNSDLLPRGLDSRISIYVLAEHAISISMPVRSGNE
jgi:hypothetical protein